MAKKDNKPIKVAATPLEINWSQFTPGSYSRYGQSDDFCTKFTGAISILIIWATWMGGIFSPFWMAYIFYKGYYIPFTILLVILSYPFFFKVGPWPEFVQLILGMAGWFRGGTSMVVEDTMEGFEVNGPIMLAMHPHGIMPHSFFLNGAGRIHARKPEVFLPPLYQNMSLKSTGVAEPLLFKIPIICYFLAFFGCAEPATKAQMHDIFSRRVPFGILPGGSAEILYAEYQKENIFIRKRKGFIKYALQHGYTVAIGYCFGESDLFHTLTWGRGWRLRLLKKTKFILFAAWGKWWCPILPRNDHPLNTVVGNAFELPKIENPTQADIDKWHAVYIEKLTDLFERNKGKFGYPDRTLNLY